jgi:cytochrome c oxidase cbb3-type subunit 2
VRRPLRRRIGSPAALLAAAALAVLGTADLSAQDAERGQEIYERWCVECHGAEGQGDAPAARRMLPRPRDFTGARYQIRTTPSGNIPTDDDLHRVIRDGLPGTTMPGWPNLSRSQRADVIAYLKSLSPFFEAGGTPEPIELTDDPGGGEEAVAAGREVYQELECFRCHGQAGRGDGESAPTLEDWQELPIRTADLTEPWNFNGGTSVEAIHTRFLTGLDGTPMPTQMDAVESGVVTREDLWHLAHYVRSLAPERVPPRVRDAVRVRRVEGGLPEGPDAEAWSEVPRFYFPLAGQVIEQPRQFEPMVDGLWVQGVHDGEEMVLRVSWSDPSQSPDPAWEEWRQKVAEHMFDDGTPIPTEPLSDRLTLQFPTSVPEGRERPYFLMGSSRSPVYLWRWDSRDGFREATATGLGTSSALAESRIEGSAGWERGQWSVTFRRPVGGDDEQRVSFPEGVPVPVAFHAWDGDNGEDETRGALSSWYFLILEEPTGGDVYVAPLVAVLLTGGLGLFLTRRARRREEEPMKEGPVSGRDEGGPRPPDDPGTEAM